MRFGVAGALTAVVFALLATHAAGAQSQPQSETSAGSEPAAPRTTPAAVVGAIDIRAWNLLAAGLQDDDGSHRADVVAALGTIGLQKPVVRLIESALNDKDEDVRQVAAAALGDVKSRTSIPRLRQALADESPEVRFTAARALWQMGDRSGRDLFVGILSGEEPATVGIVEGKFSQAREKLHNPALLALIGAKHAASALLGPFAIGISVAEELKKDPSAPARALSATTLGADPDPGSFQQLVLALGDKNWVVRSAAAKALGDISHKAAISHLEPLLEDDKRPVRYMAAASIVRLARGRRRPGR